MALVDDFKNRFPEFDAEIVDRLLPAVEGVWPCYFGGAYTACNKEIILNLLAHLMVMEQSPGSSAVRSQSGRSVGSLSISFDALAKQSGLTDFFGSTKYGQRFLYLTGIRRRAYFV